MVRLKLGLYHRVSTLDQDPTLARGELEAAAARLGQVVLNVEETGSGARSDRPGLARIMAAARAGTVDGVLVWKLDRFGRSVLDLVANVRELKSRGVRFLATSQGIDIGPSSGAVGDLLVTVLAAVAEFERELTRERTRLGHDKARRAGKHIGRPRAELSEEVIHKAAELRIEHPGLSWRQIVKRLQARGVHNLPDPQTVARACAKAYPEVPRGRPGWPRASSR